MAIASIVVSEQVMMTLGTMAADGRPAVMAARLNKINGQEQHVLVRIDTQTIHPKTEKKIRWIRFAHGRYSC